MRTSTEAATPKASANSPRKALCWEEHKERTQRDLLASVHRPGVVLHFSNTSPM
jgi:hypothetical protein